MAKKKAEEKSISPIKQAFNVLKNAELPDMKAVAGEFFDLIGGPRAFALMLKEEFDRSPPGGQTRARIMDTVLGTLRAATAKEAPRDSNLLSDEDIERELQSHLLKLTSKTDISNTTPEATDGEKKATEVG